MAFSTTSYFAGIGTVLAALAVGFSGGFFLAPSSEQIEQNRLQRITSSAPIMPETETAQPRSIELTAAAAVPAPSTQQPTRPESIPVMAKAVETATPSVAKAAEPIRSARQDAAAKSEINAEKLRAAEVKAERKRVQRLAERRKQREIDLATVAVKRMPWDPGPQQFADRTESPRFGFFGQD